MRRAQPPRLRPSFHPLREPEEWPKCPLLPAKAGTPRADIITPGTSGHTCSLQPPSLVWLDKRKAGEEQKCKSLFRREKCWGRNSLRASESQKRANCHRTGIHSKNSDYCVPSGGGGAAVKSEHFPVVTSHLLVALRSIRGAIGGDGHQSYISPASRNFTWSGELKIL